MAYTLTQARPLLNAAELELFEQSRTEPVKRLAPAKLAGAVKRTRTLRDKYRDLYQRQTVAVRTRAPGAVTGDDNERTQRKADILQEVLDRYEARATLLSGRDSSKAKDTATTGKAAARVGAGQGVKTAATKTPRAGAAAQGAAAGKTARPASTAKAPKAEKSAGSAPARSSKAPSRKAPTANNKASAPNVNAPLDIVPAAKRASPLKQDPTNTAIHGHQSSQGRRTQGKRDSR
ncbi:MAG: hypothetical protein ABI845_11265 [Polaromonas sp.]